MYRWVNKWTYEFTRVIAWHYAEIDDCLTLSAMPALSHRLKAQASVVNGCIQELV